MLKSILRGHFIDARSADIQSVRHADVAKW